MTLGDIDASDEFYASTIQFLTSGGATATVDDPVLGTVKATYKFVWAEESGAGVRGWYLFADENSLYPKNDVQLKAGEGFCLDLDFNEDMATLNFAGQVDDEDNVMSFTHTSFNYIGNGSPVDITLGDIDASDEFYASTIQFLTSGGATATVDDPVLGTVKATYKFVWAEESAAGVRGWYLFADEPAQYPKNDRVIKAGEAFCLDLDFNEDMATVTFPAAL